MSRNLCQSTCCENTVRLSDLRGKPIEFRQYFNSPPVIGTRWDCPSCEVAYFAIWRDAQWSWETKRYGNFVIDLSYYESYNDEHGSPEEIDNPSYLCEDNAEEWQDIW